MRTIRIMQHTSIDGVIQPGQPGEYADDFANGGWTTPYRSPGGREAVEEAQGEAFDLLLGRRTYDLWSGYWPKAEKSSLADSLNNATKYVATHRPESLGWGPVGLLRADIVEGVRVLRSQDGPDLVVWGSATLTTTLLAHGLVDEIVLIVYPILMGRGKRFFSDSADPRELALISTRSTPAGVLFNTYRHVGPLQTEPAPPV